MSDPTLLLALALLAASPAHAAQQAAPAPNPERHRLSLPIPTDLAAHHAFLDHLAALRTARRTEDFRQTLGAYRAELLDRSRGLRARILADGARVESELWLMPTLIVEDASGELVSELDAWDHVESTGAGSLRAPQTLKVALNFNHHDAAGANGLTVGGVPVEGDGVTIAIVDTGIDLDTGGKGRPHRAFYENGSPSQTSIGIDGSRILSALSTYAAAGDPDDLHGHGTRMASLAAGARWPSTVPGVADSPAPSAFLRSYDITADNPAGLASVCDMVAAFDHLAAEPDVLVANMSYDGSFGAEIAPNPMIDLTVRSGIVVTLSAGNQGSGSIMHGAYNAIPVGASFDGIPEVFDDGSVFLSAVGPLPDGRAYPAMVAIGMDLTSATLDDEASATPSWGTSGAAAITAGSAALVRHAAPQFDALETKAVLLNGSNRSVAGDPNAIGIGYLHTKQAVEDALAGEVVSRTTGNLDTATWQVPLEPGETLDVAVVWEREMLGFLGTCMSELAPGYLGNPAVADVDVVLRSSTGAVEASSFSDRDNVEALSFQSAAGGLYELDVEVVSFEESVGSVTYAVAGVSGPPTSVVQDPCGGSAPSVFSAQAGALVSSTPSKTQYTVLKGCGLDQVVSAAVGGVPTTIVPYSSKALRLDLPTGMAPGTHQVDLTLSDGSVLGSAVVVGLTLPVLTAPYDNASVSIGMPVQVQRNPYEVYGIVASLVLGQTGFPGITVLGIGGGNPSHVFLVDSGILDTDGLGGFKLTGVGGLGVGTKILFQAVVFDFTWLGLVPSNLATTLVVV